MPVHVFERAVQGQRTANTKAGGGSRPDILQKEQEDHCETGAAEELGRVLRNEIR